MSDKQQAIYTTMISAKLNKLELNLQYKLMLSSQIGGSQEKINLAEELAKLPVIANIQVKIANVNHYLVLLTRDYDTAGIAKENFWQVLTFNNYADAGIRDHHILQLLINRVLVGEYGKDINLTTEYLWSAEEWKRNQGKQRYALKVYVDSNSNLRLSVVTFTRVTAEADKKRQYYYWSTKYQRMVWDRNIKSPILYIRKNGNNSKNTISYLDMDEINLYRKSKVGIIGELLGNLRRHDGKLFIKLPEFRLRTLCAYYYAVTKQDKGNLWPYASGMTVNIYCDPSNKMAEMLRDGLAHELEGQVSSYDIKVTATHSSTTGLNIQVIDDVRKDSSKEELYEASRDVTIIQHITLQGFGEFNDTETPERWCEKLQHHNSIISTTKMIKLSQELIIRRDLMNEKITTVAPDKLAKIAQYEFFYVVGFDKKKRILQLVQLTTFNNGHFEMNEITFDTSKSLANHPFRDFYNEIIFSDRSLEAGWGWSNVQGIIKLGQGYMVIKQTEQRVMPDERWVDSELKAINPDLRMNRQVLLTVVKRQLEEIDVSSKDKKLVRLEKKLNVFITGVKSRELSKKINVSAREVTQAIKNVDEDRMFNWRGPGMRDVNNNIKQNKSLNVSFISDIFKKSNQDRLRGFYGIGLLNTEYDRELLYFVGSEDAIKKKTQKAIRLKQINLIGISKTEFINKVFPDLKDMMAIKFVRNGQYTVIPFPFKYLREYNDLLSKQEKFNFKK